MGHSDWLGYTVDVPADGGPLSLPKGKTAADIHLPPCFYSIIMMMTKYKCTFFITLSLPYEAQLHELFLYKQK